MSAPLLASVRFSKLRIPLVNHLLDINIKYNLYSSTFQVLNYDFITYTPNTVIDGITNLVKRILITFSDNSVLVYLFGPPYTLTMEEGCRSFKCTALQIIVNYLSAVGRLPPYKCMSTP